MVVLTPLRLFLYLFCRCNFKISFTSSTTHSIAQTSSCKIRFVLILFCTCANLSCQTRFFHFLLLVNSLVSTHKLHHTLDMCRYHPLKWNWIVISLFHVTCDYWLIVFSFWIYPLALQMEWKMTKQQLNAIHMKLIDIL